MADPHKDFVNVSGVKDPYDAWLDGDISTAMLLGEDEDEELTPEEELENNLVAAMFALCEAEEGDDDWKSMMDDAVCLYKARLGRDPTVAEDARMRQITQTVMAMTPRELEDRVCERDVESDDDEELYPDPQAPPCDEGLFELGTCLEFYQVMNAYELDAVDDHLRAPFVGQQQEAGCTFADLSRQGELEQRDHSYLVDSVADNQVQMGDVPQIVKAVLSTLQAPSIALADNSNGLSDVCAFSDSVSLNGDAAAYQVAPYPESIIFDADDWMEDEEEEMTLTNKIVKQYVVQGTRVVDNCNDGGLIDVISAISALTTLVDALVPESDASKVPFLFGFAGHGAAFVGGARRAKRRKRGFGQALVCKGSQPHRFGHHSRDGEVFSAAGKRSGGHSLGGMKVGSGGALPMSTARPPGVVMAQVQYMWSKARTWVTSTSTAASLMRFYLQEIRALAGSGQTRARCFSWSAAPSRARAVDLPCDTVQVNKSLHGSSVALKIVNLRRVG
jgi:hypothetical protein